MRKYTCQRGKRRHAKRAPAAALVLDAYLNALWAETGLGPDDTVLVGFSQGGMMALYQGLRMTEPPRLIVSFSGGLIAPETLPVEPVKRPPVALAHGGADPMVPVVESQKAERVLKEKGYAVGLHVSPGAGHTITQVGFGFACQYLAGAFDIKLG